MAVGIHTGEHTVSKPAGATFLTDFLGSMVEHDTQQCVHCGRHWEVKPGSGKMRSYCSKCNGHTCGAPACVRHCRPYEQQIDDAEKGVIIIP